MSSRKCPRTLAVLVLCTVVADAGSPSGVYTDNGVQTIRQDHQLSAEEWTEIEREMLAAFGVPNKSRRARRNLDGSASQFLFDIYRSIERDGPPHGREPRSVSDVGRLYDDHVVQDSDVIVTLYLSNYPPKINIRHEHGRCMLFELNHVPPKETHTITLAEVYLYKSGVTLGENVEPYTVTLYQVITKESGKELEFVDTQNTASDFDGWLRFNVTTALVSWTHSLSPNNGLYVSIHPLDNKEGGGIKPDNIGLVTSTGEQKSSESTKPFMAVYLKTLNGENIVTDPSLRKRRRRRRQQQLPETTTANPFQNISNTFVEPEVQGCQIQTLYVSFKDLEWQDWIIAPDGYGAYFCTGTCNFPLNSHMNATNHAIVQTLVHLMKPLQIPKPCCAPTKMTQQAILFFLDDYNVILKKYRNMIVKSCGCH